MEVKPGYKNTELGMIPEDWEVEPLGSIAMIATGNTPPTRDPTNYGDEFLFVSPVDMGWTKRIIRTEKMLSKKGFSISRPFPAGSILFVCIGSTIGKCGIASETLTSNQQINAILPAEGTSFDYLYYAVSAVAAKVRSLAGEQAVPIVNKTQFSETRVPIPPTLAEQESIAAVLSDADALIESLEQLIAKKRQVKQGTMQELLTGRRRLPGFNDEWKTSFLGDCGEVIMGQSPPGSSYNRTGNGSPLINGPTEFTDRHPIKIQWTTQPARFCTTGDLLICVRGSSTGRTNYADDTYAIGRGVAAIREGSQRHGIPKLPGHFRCVRHTRRSNGLDVSQR